VDQAEHAPHAGNNSARLPGSVYRARRFSHVPDRTTEFPEGCAPYLVLNKEQSPTKTKYARQHDRKPQANTKASFPSTRLRESQVIIFE
jgi:hypothetical protein